MRRSVNNLSRLQAEADGLLYVTNGSDSVFVMNTNTNTVITTIVVGRSPTKVSFDPTHRRMYVSNLDGNTVSVIDTKTNTLIATITVDEKPVAMTFDPTHQRMYVRTSQVLYLS